MGVFLIQKNKKMLCSYMKKNLDGSSVKKVLTSAQTETKKKPFAVFFKPHLQNQVSVVSLIF
jgi:hypothetical protein